MQYLFIYFFNYIFFFAGEARASLKWADGRIIKNEVDMQVSCVFLRVSVS